MASCVSQNGPTRRGGRSETPCFETVSLAVGRDVTRGVRIRTEHHNVHSERPGGDEYSRFKNRPRGVHKGRRGKLEGAIFFQRKNARAAKKKQKKTPLQ